MTAKQVREVKQALDRVSHVDKIIHHRTTNEIEVRRGYFYRHGETQEHFAADIQAAIPTAKITAAYDRWNTWPNDSYFEVRFQLPSAK